MNVLSLFDGMSCGQIALDALSIDVERYFASEIKQHAIAITSHNYPNTEYVGDVQGVKKSDFPKIDILLAGSPCQDFSQLNAKRHGLKGSKSSLFFEFLRVLESFSPHFFLLENVVMESNQAATISRLVGVAPVRIDAALIGPVHRNRLYWTNIPGEGRHLLGSYITAPEKRTAPFQGILDYGYTPKRKGYCLTCGNGGFPITPHRKYHRWQLGGFGNLVFESRSHYEDCRRAFRGKDFENQVFGSLRTLNPTELERCHEIPAGYCDALTPRQTEDVIGDGWHVGTIKHIMKGLL